MEPLKLVVIDDHKIMRDGLKALFRRNPSFLIVADFDNGEQLFDYLEKNPVDVILMDIHLLTSNGLDIARQVKEHDRNIRIIMHTMSEDVHDIERARQIGAEGYVVKNYGQKELEKALEEVAGGAVYYSL
jgi:DNA-binding NarL/FixJ family response regulator